MKSYLDFLLDIIKNKSVYGPILTLIVSYLVYKIVKSALKKAIEKGKKDGYELKRRKTVVHLITNFLKFVVIIIDTLIILNIFNVNTVSILASLGVASAVVGLAFQDTLKDIIGGISIILENYFIVGDIVRYGDFMGEIVSFGFKSTKIRNLSNEILTVSNRNISEIVNLSQSKASVVINIPVAYEEKTEKVEKVIDAILKEIETLENVETGSTTYLGIDALNESSVTYMIRFLSDHDTQFQSRRNALKIVKKHLDKNGIKIPYNQIEVHNGKNI